MHYTVCRLVRNSIPPCIGLSAEKIIFGKALSRFQGWARLCRIEKGAERFPGQRLYFYSVFYFA
ncbi:hypothetical protein BIY26_06755 [Brenneria goodwinii]|uniref:Uncharacterized protein n=1 Tax=Brenneria goodwinii TaxID=1109412 RepID=A0AAE8EPS4_9GAMM|nr:hypothetical protein BIY26_06755 [Brenneria goodwinii]